MTKTKPPIAPSASARKKMFWSTSSLLPAPLKKRSIDYLVKNRKRPTKFLKQTQKKPLLKCRIKLRSVNHEELIAVETAIDRLTTGKRSRRRRTLDADSVGNVFGIDLDEPIANPPAFEPTGACIRTLREKLGLSPSEFAHKIGVSVASVKKWEQAPLPLNLQAKSLQCLKAAFADAYRS